LPVWHFGDRCTDQRAVHAVAGPSSQTHRTAEVSSRPSPRQPPQQPWHSRQCRARQVPQHFLSLPSQSLWSTFDTSRFLAICRARGLSQARAAAPGSRSWCGLRHNQHQVCSLRTGRVPEWPIPVANTGHALFAAPVSRRQLLDAVALSAAALATSPLAASAAKGMRSHQSGLIHGCCQP
jgi:hypothetical protein